MRLTHNMHVHSRVSLCARPEMELAAMLRAAQEAGLDLLGLTDHIDEPGDPAREALVLANRELAARLESPVRLLIGTETTVLSPGKPAASEATREALDFVSVAVNHYHVRNVEHPAEPTPGGYAQHHLVMIRATVLCPNVDIVVHPFMHRGLPFTDQAPMLAAYDPGEVRETLELMAAQGVRMELNPGHVARAPEFFSSVVQAGREVGLRFVLGTDAHQLSNIAYGEHAIPALEKIGLAEDDIALPERVLSRCEDVPSRAPRQA